MALALGRAGTATRDDGGLVHRIRASHQQRVIVVWLELDQVAHRHFKRGAASGRNADSAPAMIFSLGFLL